MCRAGEHVHGAGTPGLVAETCEELHVPAQGGGVTGNVDHPLRRHPHPYWLHSRGTAGLLSDGSGRLWLAVPSESADLPAYLAAPGVVPHQLGAPVLMEKEAFL